MSELKLVWDADQALFCSGNINLRLCTDTDVLPTDTVTVIEEDRWRVLNPENVLYGHQQQHPIRIMTDLVEQKALATGEVLVHGNTWIAILYDLDATPICQESWISQALEKIFSLALEKAVTDISLPLPGVAHAHIDLQDSLAILVDAMQKYETQQRLSIWIRIPDNSLSEVSRVLAMLTQ